MSKLIIAEKPSVAKSIASALGASSRADGFYEGSGLLVSWCVGHLVSPLDAGGYDERFKKWRYEDLPILPEPFRYAPIPGKEAALDNVKRLMAREDVTEIVNACDAGREGELIFRLVYEMAGCRKPVLRLWISSMEDSAIREGFSELRPGADYEALYQSALCRQRADWLVGISHPPFLRPLPPYPERGPRPNAHLVPAGGAGREDRAVPEGEVSSCAPDPGRRGGGIGEIHRSGGGGAGGGHVQGRGRHLYLRHL